MSGESSIEQYPKWVLFISLGSGNLEPDENNGFTSEIFNAGKNNYSQPRPKPNVDNLKITVLILGGAI
jgi:hypothetical protein